MALGTVRAQDHAATQVARVELVVEGHEVLFAGIDRRKMDGAYEPHEITIFVEAMGNRVHGLFYHGHVRNPGHVIPATWLQTAKRPSLT